MTNKPTRIAALRISNILGITEAEIHPGRVTLIEGANGLGKTSILEAFRAVLSGGHDATLLRAGADHGEIVMVLEDGGEIIKSITAERSTVSYMDPELGKISKPRTIIDKLCDAFALNPVDFLTAKKEMRLQLLLQAIPMKISAMDLAEIKDFCVNPIDFNRHALHVIEAIDKDLYDQRTGINRALKDKKATVEELKKSLPREATEAGWEEKLRDAKAAQSTFITECAQRARNINETATSHERDTRTAAFTARAKLQEERDAQLEKIRLEYQSKIDDVALELDRKLKSITGAASVSHEMLADERRGKEQVLAKTVADTEAAAKTFIQAQAARDHVQHLESGIAMLDSDSSALTGALRELERLKSDLLDRLPIKGVEVKEGDIFVDGIPFDRVNESSRVRLAVEVAMLRAGALPILCVDGIERLDSQSIQSLEDVATEKNIQLVLARVTDSALEVKVLA